MGITIRSKRILVPTLATAAVLVAGGGVAYAVLEDDEKLTGSQRDRAEQAALAEVDGGRVLEAEADDEGGQRQYEVEVLDVDGIEWDIVLDENFEVVVADRDDHDGDGHDRVDDADDHDATEDAEDVPVSAADRERVGAAGAAAVPGGEAVDVDHGDTTGVAWEVEVVDGQGRDWDVTLDEQLTVLDAVRD